MRKFATINASKGELNMNYILAKVFNNATYAETFLTGKLYINTLTSFGIGNLYNPHEDMTNKYRGDVNEGLKSNIPSDDIISTDSAYNFFKGIGAIPYEGIAVGELDSRLLNEHIMSLLALYYDSENKTFIAPDKQMLSFDEKQAGATIIIYNVQEFLRRLSLTLVDTLGSPFWFAYGLVDYCLSSNERHEAYEFTKTKEYKWQQEFRVAVDLGVSDFKVCSNRIAYDSNSGAIIIDIGDISDIAFSLPTSDFINLKFPQKYNGILHTSPKQICPFYPPKKNTISYACPVRRNNDKWYYGTQAMYPIMRDTRNYAINRFFADKARKMTPETDSFFMELANLYFRHQLDIYKSEFNNENLSSLLSAIVAYMIMLQITSLADVHLAVDSEGIQPSYHNLNVTDKRLLDKAHSYRNISKHPIHPQNTDYAELSSISDDTEFPEYEYEGKKYCRIVVNQNAVLSSGLEVKKGEAVWVEVSKVKWFVVPKG